MQDRDPLVRPIAVVIIHTKTRQLFKWLRKPHFKGKKH